MRQRTVEEIEHIMLGPGKLGTPQGDRFQVFNDTPLDPLSG